ncbi:MAG: hypothetical protein ACKOZY_07760, partial [Flavobacteriales bacterium]
ARRSIWMLPKMAIKHMSLLIHQLNLIQAWFDGPCADDFFGGENPIVQNQVTRSGTHLQVDRKHGSFAHLNDQNSLEWIGTYHNHIPFLFIMVR